MKLDTIASLAPDTVCAEDSALQHWTFLRYCVLGSIVLYKVLQVRAKAMDKSAYPSHPKMCGRIKENSFIVGFIIAGFLFIQTEGVGLTVYFAVSAICDNFVIFVVHHDNYCQCIQAISLYLMALLSFLPTSFTAVYFQEKMYDNGTWGPSTIQGAQSFGKVLFLALMTAVTILFFFLRLIVVYYSGVISFVDSWIHGVASLVLAIAVPPMVDGIQAMVLVKSGLKSADARQLPTDSSEEEEREYVSLQQ